MKIWKLVGCLVLLVVIICGCVALGQASHVAAQSGGTDGASDPTEESTLPEDEQNAEGEQESSATVSKTYSEGLEFRSNGDGTCAIAGLGSCTASCILIPPKSPAGDTVTEILPYAFADTIVGAIELPAGITTLTAASFARCPRLSLVRVDTDSAAFSEYDGVLYSKDGGLLIYCPAGRSAAELRLHRSLKRIAAGAFAECGKLSTVYFTGSTSEWHSLTVGDGNDSLYSAALKFNAQ